MARSPLWDNSDFLADCRSDMRKKDVMEKWGVSSGLVVDVRRSQRGDSSVTPGGTVVSVSGAGEQHDTASKTSSYVLPGDEAWGEDDFRAFLTSKGTDPDAVTFQWGWTTNPAGGVWNKLSNVRPKVGVGADPVVSPEAVFEAARNFTYIPEHHERSARSLVIVPTDLQMGKTDIFGSHPETINQALRSFARAADFARSNPVDEICIVDAGDIVENTFNTPSQIATNSLDLPHQIVEAAFVMQRGIQMLAPLAPKITYAAVSSNHGQYRTGFKQAGGDAHADFGLAIAKVLENAFALNPAAYGHVEFVTPDPYMESLSFETSGTTLGVVHGHQTNSADKIGQWWQGQSHGRMPTADADILLVGHWHSFRVQQSGDARWIVVGPSSDRGSSWFTNLKGESSESGMLMFTTAGGRWADLRIV